MDALRYCAAINVSHPSQINFLFTKGKHYVLPSHYQNDFTSISSDGSGGFEYDQVHQTFFGSEAGKIRASEVTFKPYLCSETVVGTLDDLCKDTSDEVRLIPKIHNFHFRFHQKLTVQDMIIDGSDLMIWRDCTGSSCCTSALNNESHCCNGDMFDAGKGCQYCRHYASQEFTYSSKTYTRPAGRCDIMDTSQDPDAPSSEGADKYNIHLPLFILDLSTDRTSFDGTFGLVADTEVETQKTRSAGFTMPELHLDGAQIVNFIHQPPSLINFKTSGQLHTKNTTRFENIHTRYGVITGTLDEIMPRGWPRADFQKFGSAESGFRKIWIGYYH